MHLNKSAAKKFHFSTTSSEIIVKDCWWNNCVFQKAIAKNFAFQKITWKRKKMLWQNKYVFTQPIYTKIAHFKKNQLWKLWIFPILVNQTYSYATSCEGRCKFCWFLVKQTYIYVINRKKRREFSRFRQYSCVCTQSIAKKEKRDYLLSIYPKCILKILSINHFIILTNLSLLCYKMHLIFRRIYVLPKFLLPFFLVSHFLSHFFSWKVTFFTFFSPVSWWEPCILICWTINSLAFLHCRNRWQDLPAVNQNAVVNLSNTTLSEIQCSILKLNSNFTIS